MVNTAVGLALLTVYMPRRFRPEWAQDWNAPLRASLPVTLFFALFSAFLVVVPWIPPQSVSRGSVLVSPSHRLTCTFIGWRGRVCDFMVSRFSMAASGLPNSHWMSFQVCVGSRRRPRLLRLWGNLLVHLVQTFASLRRISIGARAITALRWHLYHAVCEDII